MNVSSSFLTQQSFASQASADCGQPALLSAVRWKLKHRRVLDTHAVVVEVHQIIGKLVQPPWGVEGVILIVVKVSLQSLHLPLHVASSILKFLHALVGGIRFDEPVGSDHSAAVGPIAAEAAVVLLRESQVPLIQVMDSLLSTTQWLQGVLANLQTEPQQRSWWPLTRVMSSRLFLVSMQILPVVFPERGPMAADSLKATSYWSGKTGGVREVARARSMAASKSVELKAMDILLSRKVMINVFRKLKFLTSIIDYMIKMWALHIEQIISTLPHHKQTLLATLALLSALYIVFALFDISVIIAFLMCIGSLACLAQLRWRALKNRGLINSVSPKMRDALLNRSLFDIYRDLVYFPYATKIIGAFVKGAIQKPPPDQIHELFSELPDSVNDFINTKGILHLAPEKVEKLFLEKAQYSDKELMNLQPQPPQPVVPKNFGQVDMTWDHQPLYDQYDIKTHERSFGQEILHDINEKVTWGHVMGIASLVLYGVMKTKGRKMGKIFLYNGSAAGVLLLGLLVLVKLKRPEYSYKLSKKRKMNV